jgi:hypothetical protein
MSELFTITSNLLSDAVLFAVLQVGLVVFVLSAVLRNWIAERRAGPGEPTLRVTRSERSMSRFYATYAAINGLLVAICLSVDVAANHRVVWVLLDTALVAYVCLINPWFRNLLVEWSIRLPKIEAR